MDSRKKAFARQLGFIVGLVFFLFLFWNSIIIYPLKLLVVFFHELSHGLAAVLTGGEIIRIEIVAMQGGVCYFKGGIPFITASAGYLGSLLWGVVIYLTALFTRKDKEVCFVLGLIILGITLLYIRNLFGFFFCLFFAIALMLSGKYLGEMFNDLTLRTIGMTSMLYAPLDIYDDVIRRSYLTSSDGAAIAKMFGSIPILGNTVFWGVFWVLLSFLILGVSLFLGLKVKSEQGRSYF
ncbi:M50 family metallopeptidase [Candidatus Riflebacteria bacterium]